MAAEPRDLLIIAATLAALGGGLFAVAQRQSPAPRPPVKQTQPVEQTKQPQKKEVAPVPKLTAPAPIVQPERKARGKGMRNKRERPKRAAEKRSGLPSCARIKAQYDRMPWAQKLAAYSSASPEQVAHGRRCLGI